MGRSRALALTVLCAATMMIILDGTIVTVALPAIQRDLGFSSSGLAWVVNAYLIAFGGLLLLLAGRLGDLIGGKRVFLAGLAVFVVASLLCGVSVSQPMLIAARGPHVPWSRTGLVSRPPRHGTTSGPNHPPGPASSPRASRHATGEHALRRTRRPGHDVWEGRPGQGNHRSATGGLRRDLDG